MRWILGRILGCLLGIACVVSAGKAFADVAPQPYVILTLPSRCPLANCTIASGNASQVVLNANSGRKMFCLSNPTSAAEDLFYDFGQAANDTSPTSLVLAAGGTVCMGGAAIWQGSVSVNAVTTSHVF